MSASSTARWVATAAAQATAYVALWLALTEFLKHEHVGAPLRASLGSIVVLVAAWSALLAYRLWRERPG